MQEPKKIDQNLAPIRKRSLADDITTRLRDAISRGDLTPGQRLREEELSEFLEVSRGPIREALRQLEREGLVVKRLNSGTTVARLLREDLEEVYSLRMVLEKFAVQLACKRVEPEQMKRLEVLLDTLREHVERGISEADAAELDIQFHEMLVQASKHSRLFAAWSVLKPQIHIFFLTTHVANPRFRELMLPSHQDILNAIKVGDPANAADVIEGHLEAAYDLALSTYLEQNQEMDNDND